MRFSPRICWIIVWCVVFLLMPGCAKKKSAVTITDIWGKGYSINPGAGGGSSLQFRVTVENRSDVDALISDFLVEVMAGETTILAVQKVGDAEYQNLIKPDPSSSYQVKANSSFIISLDYLRHEDLYNGKNPDTIKVTLIIEDDEGTYTIELSGLFTFSRL